jgi:hypothetical protein
LICKEHSFYLGEKKVSTEKIDFGVGISMPVKPELRERTEKFLAEILHLKQTLKSEHYSCYQFPNGQIIGITSDQNAPTELEYEQSTWLEIVTSDFDATKKRLIEFGVRRVNEEMKDAFFFNLPGGAVFRLISEKQAKEMSS